LSDLQEAELYTIEMKICPSSLEQDRMNLLEAQHPAFQFYLQRKDDGFCLTATVNTKTGWQSTDTDMAVVKPNTWATVSMVMTGDEVAVGVNRQIVGRRVFQSLTQIPVGEGGMTLGASTAGPPYQFSGQVADLMIWDTVPGTYEHALTVADSVGLGEIESKYLDLGGPGSFLRSPTGPEKVIGKGRVRTYQGGTIYWSFDSGAHEVHGQILNFYNSAGGPTGYLGFPRTDEMAGARPNSRKSLFENGGIYWSASTGAHEVHGAIFIKYLDLLEEQGFLGLPTSDESSVAGGRASEFQGGLVLWSPDTGAHEVHGSILTRYRALGGPGGFLGLPLTDESNVLAANGQPSGGKSSRFRGGTIYWSPASGAFEVHGAIRYLYEEKLGGPFSDLGYPVSDESAIQNSAIRYNNFQKGVIVWTPSNGARALTQLDLYLGWVRCSGIDDGWFDSSAELVNYTSVWVNGNPLEVDVRRPSDHAGDSYDLNRTYHISPMRADTVIRFRIRVDDWDMTSNNDHLGDIDHTFDIHSFWGMDNGSNGVYVGVPATVKDEMPREDTLKFDFRLAPPSVPIDPNQPFRNQGWWSFDNFKTPSLDRVTYANTFRDVEVTGNWFEEFINPFDSLYYYLAYKGIAAGGNCFGMSLEAAYALAGRSVYAEPIFQYVRTAGTDRVINLKHGYQIGAESIRWIIGQLTNLNMVRPMRVFDRVRGLIDSGERPLVSMFNLSDFSGHTVLAYTYKKGPAGGPSQIFVADPNCPWSEAPGNPSVVECYPNDTFRFVSNGSVRYQSSSIAGGLLPGTVMYHTPFHILGGQPRTPFWEILGALTSVIGGFILIAGDASAEQLKAGNANFYTAAHGIEPGSVPGLARIPFFDMTGAPPEFYSYVGAGPASLDLSLLGKRTGSYQANLRSSRNAVALNGAITQGARDTLSMVEYNSSRPQLVLQTTEELKSARANYAVLLDRRGRDYRAFEADLQLARGAVTRMGAAQHGSALVVENPGPARALDFHFTTVEARRVRRSVISVSQELGTGLVQLRPEDPVALHGKFVVERVSSIGGPVVKRAVVQSRPVTP